MSEQMNEVELSEDIILSEIQEYEKIGYLNEDFRFFYLKDTKMRSFDYHYHDFDKLLIFVSGIGAYHIEGKTYQLSPFDIVCIPHGDIHCPEIDFSKPYERYILYISPEFYTKHIDDEDSLVLTCLLDNSRKTDDYVYHTSVSSRFLLEQLLSELKQHSDETAETTLVGRDLYAKTLLMQLLIRLARFLEDGSLMSEQKPSFNERIVEIIRYINDNYSKDLSVEFLAEQFFISRYYLMRQFKEATGYTLHNYINNKRLLAARDAIKSGIPATTAALNCGFHDYSTFSRAYKKAFQTAPTSITS